MDHLFKIRVSTFANLTRDESRDLLIRLIDIGIKDAHYSPDDYDDTKIVKDLNYYIFNGHP